MNVDTASASTFFSMNAWPMPRVRMKVSAPRCDFLVLRDRRHQVGGRSERAGNILQSRRQAGGGEVLGDAAGILGGREAEPGGKAVREDHADGDAFAMQQAVGVAGDLFQRVAESVAEIEQGADAGFLLVGEHEADLCLAGAGDGLGAGGAAVEDVVAMFLEPEVEGLVVDQAVLHHLGVAGGELARRRGFRAP